MLNPPRRPLVPLTLVALAFALGCEQPADIKTYTVASSGPRSKPFPIDQMDQILVAIVPQGDKAWFFKLNGKKPAIERQRQSFEAFLAGVQLSDNAEDTPSWKVPDGWSERGESEMRAATLIVPDEGGELQLAVSSLPLPGEWEDFLVPNVNRWLRQLGCDSLPKATILKLAKQAKTENGEATIFQLAGIMQQQSMGSNPHAGLGIPAPPKSAKAEASSPPVASESSELAYAAPAGWLPGKMSMMRKAAFFLPGGQESGEVTVTRFPAGGGQMSDVQANVLRWAGQVGMSPPSADELEELTQRISIDGNDGTYVELSSPESSERRVSLFVAMAEREGQVWFFKMIGKADVVSGQTAQFKEFLGSVRFK